MTTSTTGGYITVTLRVFRDEETNQYVALCEELETSSCGDDLDSAFENIIDATVLYVNSIEKVGERERIFRERGIHIMRGDPPEVEPEVQVRARRDEYVTPHNLPMPLAV
jgi:predicted RNase H-like HicB family nuclease